MCGKYIFEINFTGKQRPHENLHRVKLTIDRKRFLILKTRTREEEHKNTGTQEHRNMLEYARTCQNTRTCRTTASCQKNLINKTKTSTYHSPCWKLNTPTARLLVNQDGGLDARRTQATHKFSFNSFIIILNFFKSNCMLIFIFWNSAMFWHVLICSGMLQSSGKFQRFKF